MNLYEQEKTMQYILILNELSTLTLSTNYLCSMADLTFWVVIINAWLSAIIGDIDCIPLLFKNVTAVFNQNIVALLVNCMPKFFDLIYGFQQ